MYNLFLDDIRQPSGPANYMPTGERAIYLMAVWEVVRNYEEFVQIIKERGLPALISFDHDLADIHYDPSTWVESFVYHEKTGMDCAKWLVEYCLDNSLELPKYLVHSQNPVGGKNISSLLSNFKQHQNQMGKLNVLLAQTDQLGAVIKKNLLDSISQFKNKQAYFKGEKVVYKERSDEYADSKLSVDKPVASTVKEWLNYTFKHAGEFLATKLDQEATNCSGTAKAKLVIEGVDYGELTTGELMALKGFFEQQAVRDMFEAMPTISLSEKWVASTNPEYAQRGILETETQKWIDKSTETTPEVKFDPAGKQPGVIINIKSTIEKADVSRQTFTGEISHIERAAILARLTKVIIAIKGALEVANGAEVVSSKFDSQKLLNYLKG